MAQKGQGWEWYCHLVMGRLDNGHAFERGYIGLYQSLYNMVGKSALTYGSELIDEDSESGEELVALRLRTAANLYEAKNVAMQLEAFCLSSSLSSHPNNFHQPRNGMTTPVGCLLLAVHASSPWL